MNALQLLVGICVWVFGEIKGYSGQRDSVHWRIVSLMEGETGDGEGRRRQHHHRHHQNLPSLSHVFNSFSLNNSNNNNHKTLIILIPIPNYHRLQL